MRPPRQAEAYADRPLDCEEAMEDGQAALEGQAIEVGWTREETLLAVRGLALWWLKGDAAREADEANIRAVSRGVSSEGNENPRANGGHERHKKLLRSGPTAMPPIPTAGSHPDRFLIFSGRAADLLRDCPA